MKTGRTLKFLFIFFMILVVLTATSFLFNAVGAIFGFVFGLAGLLLELVFSKSILTLLVVGLIAYLILNKNNRGTASSGHCDLDY